MKIIGTITCNYNLLQIHFYPFFVKSKQQKKKKKKSNFPQVGGLVMRNIFIFCL